MYFLKCSKKRKITRKQTLTYQIVNAQITNSVNIYIKGNHSRITQIIALCVNWNYNTLSSQQKCTLQLILVQFIFRSNTTFYVGCFYTRRKHCSVRGRMICLVFSTPLQTRAATYQQVRPMRVKIANTTSSSMLSYRRCSIKSIHWLPLFDYYLLGQT